MADGEDSASEDQWLYGESNPPQSTENTESGVTDESRNGDAFLNSMSLDTDLQPPGVSETSLQPLGQEGIQNDESEEVDPSTDNPVEGGEEVGSLQIDEGREKSALENGELPPESGEFEDDDDSEDDTVNVVIGDIRTAPQYSSLNIKRGGLLTNTGIPPQLKQPGKFSIEEFEQAGTINGMPAHEYNLDNLEDKPWRKPGADITDYFNYGFNEDTWRAYCERQKRIRIHESGVGLAPLNSNIIASTGSSVRQPSAPMDNHQFTTPPPSRRITGPINVIGGQSLPTRRTNESPPKENIIQVMTADRREYSRKGFPDIMVPPPGTAVPPPSFPPGLPPPHLGNAPPGFGGPYTGEFYPTDMDPYYAYEPTQDSQWGSQILDKPIKQEPIDPDLIKDEDRRERDRDRERERERERDRDRDRHRERERHRHRSRSRSTERRSRKHKSRSRSPGHRSHKKKKSKKSDRQKEETSE